MDANFAGMHRYEDPANPENPESVCNLTSFVITMERCPDLMGEQDADQDGPQHNDGKIYCAVDWYERPNYS